MLQGLKGTFIQWIFDRYMRWRLSELVRPNYLVMLEYPIDPKPRYGEGLPPHGQLADMLAQDDDRYAATLREMAAFIPQLLQIVESDTPANAEDPLWNNGYFSGLDAITLYGMLGLRKPCRYLEIGSGNSTKFARRAVRDLGLSTTITSIDPFPRAEIDALCDRVIRQPVEAVDDAVFDELESGDILFIDNSHRVFTNSDANVCFLEILPRLTTGVLVHVHDIFLPYDYPATWMSRHYSEQYLLAAFMIARYAKLRVVLPNAYIARHPQLNKLVDELWADAVFTRAFAAHGASAGGYKGASFWLEMV